jgi:hypothetical protein
MTRLYCILDGLNIHSNQCIILDVTNYTLVFVTVMPRHKIYASGKIVTRIQVFFEMLQIKH